MSGIVVHRTWEHHQFLKQKPLNAICHFPATAAFKILASKAARFFSNLIQGPNSFFCPFFELFDFDPFDLFCSFVTFRLFSFDCLIRKKNFLPCILKETLKSLFVIRWRKCFASVAAGPCWICQFLFFLFGPTPSSFVYLKTSTSPQFTTDDWTNIASLTWNRWAIKTGWNRWNTLTEISREKNLLSALGFNPSTIRPKSSSLSWFPFITVVSGIFCLQSRLAPNC